MKNLVGWLVGIGFIIGGATQAQAVTFLSGDIFASVSSGNVQHYRADGTFLETLNIGAGGFTTGMAFDASGNLYVTGFSAGTVAKFDTNGVLLSTFASGLATPESIVFDNAGNAYVGTLGGGIVKFAPNGTNLGIVGPNSDWIDLKADQTTMLHTHESGFIGAHNIATNAALVDFASGYGGTQAFALRVLADGGVLLADRVNVKRFNAGGSVTQTYDIAGEDSWFALNLNPDGNSFWSGNFDSANLYEFDIATGANTQTLNTGTGSNTLFGVGIFGEPTQGCTDCGGPGPNVIPEPSSLLLFWLGGLGAFGVRGRKRGKLSLF